MTIYIIGFMGSGKSTYARKFHKNSTALDCDTIIENYTKLKIQEIFKLYCEKYFRKLEMALLRDIYRLSTHYDAQSLRHFCNKYKAHNLNIKFTPTLIISTGGGIVEHKNISKWIHKKSKIIFLNKSLSRCIKNIGHKDDSRPNLANAKKLHHRRRAKYLNLYRAHRLN